MPRYTLLMPVLLALSLAGCGVNVSQNVGQTTSPLVGAWRAKVTFTSGLRTTRRAAPTGGPPVTAN